MTSDGLKDLVLCMGADLCGLAPAERFAGAPAGFRPGDVMPGCRTVLVFAKRVPAGAMHASSCIPYTFVSRRINEDIDSMTAAMAVRLEEAGLHCVPLPSDDPSEHWEPGREYARGVLSLRHAGWLAGLGVLGRNTLLVNERFGNMIQLGAILLAEELEGDPPASYELGCDGCGLCMEACPARALDGLTVDQKACRPHSNAINERGFVLKRCWRCRMVCPHCTGIASRR